VDAADKMAVLAFASLTIAGIIIAYKSYTLGEDVPSSEEILDAIERGIEKAVSKSFSEDSEDIISGVKVSEN
jgi:hypothetical protein